MSQGACLSVYNIGRRKKAVIADFREGNRNGSGEGSLLDESASSALEALLLHGREHVFVGRSA